MHKIVKYFNFLVEKILFNVSNKINKLTKNNSKISNFNKILISFISLLFLCLFYLSIPTLYDKNWVQNTLEAKLSKDYKMNFSTSSYISYNILPTPHFLIKDSEIFKDNIENLRVFSEVKKLKVFIDINFFKKEKINIKKILIDNANFFIKEEDFKTFNKISDKKIFNKKIDVSDSNIFLKSNNNETIFIVKIFKANLCCDELSFSNLFNLNLEAFKVPFKLNFNSTILPKERKEINIKAKKLKLNIFNEYSKQTSNITHGSNIITVINSKLNTFFKIKENTIVFESNNSRAKNSNTNYKGELSIKPFDLVIDINLKKHEPFKLLDVNSIMGEIIKSNMLFNENISAKISINIDSNKNDRFFKSSVIHFNVINGKINFDKTELTNNKIGNLVIIDSDLSNENDNLILNTNIVFNVQNSNNLFSFLQTPKNIRKPIKDIIINLDFNLLNSQIYINKIRLDGNESNNELMNLIKEFNDSNNINDMNFNKSKNILNEFISAYEG